MKRLLQFFCWTSLMFFSAQVFAFDLSQRVVEYHLPNGMTWLLVERHQAPVFAGYISVKVGGIDEAPGKTGLAHMFEHLMFKGTPKLAENEIWEIFARNGSPNLNASTNKDVTTYHADLPINRLELWMKVFAETFRAPSLRNFYTERSVVLEERRMRVDNDPSGQVFEKLTNTAFADGPNHWSAIGSAADIAGLTEEDAVQFYAKHYGAQNMVGVLVGDINIAATKKMLQQYFAQLPAGQKTLAPQKSTPRAGLSEQVKVAADPLLLLAYHKPVLPNSIQYTFDVAQTVLCDGPSSRLYKTLVLEKKLAKTVNCGDGYPGERSDNLLMVLTQPLKGISLKKLQQATEEVLASLESNPASAEEMLRVQRKLEADLIFSLSSNNSIAAMLASFQNLYGSWRILETYGAKIAAVQSSDLQKLAHDYFQRSNQVVIERIRK